MSAKHTLKRKALLWLGLLCEAHEGHDHTRKLTVHSENINKNNSANSPTPSPVTNRIKSLVANSEPCNRLATSHVRHLDL